MRRFCLFGLVLITAWGLAMVPASSPIAWLANEVAYVTFISHLALSFGFFQGWQNARLEEKQDKNNE